MHLMRHFALFRVAESRLVASAACLPHLPPQDGSGPRSPPAGVAPTLWSSHWPSCPHSHKVPPTPCFKGRHRNTQLIANRGGGRSAIWR